MIWDIPNFSSFIILIVVGLAGVIGFSHFLERIGLVLPLQ